MDIIHTLRDDYQRFPADQTYSIYAENVYFKDPMNEFRGRDRYQQMIKLIKTWFLNVKMDLHNIQQLDDHIRTDWTLSWNTPLPWKPRIAIDGWSELQIKDNLIISHIDYWHCSKLDVLKQHFSSHPFT
ncbi:DUF2358 domain-containing protein [Phormidesmis sp. 146-33]